MFYPSSDFPFARTFTDNWSAIRSESRGLDPTVLDIHRNGSHADYFEKIANKNGWVASWNYYSIEKNRNWLTYCLYIDGKFPPEADEKFPLIASLIKKFPQIKACALSTMKGLSMIPPHRHPELGNNLLTMHMGIALQPACNYLCVNGVFEEEREGKALVFDGSAVHFAINAGPSDRTILYLEFDRFE
jgi:beta-hydroxylase